MNIGHSAVKSEFMKPFQSFSIVAHTEIKKSNNNTLFFNISHGSHLGKETKENICYCGHSTFNLFAIFVFDK